MSETAIRVEGLSKKFCSDLRRSFFYGYQDLFSEIFLHETKRKILRKGEFWAFRDLSFELQRGETLGLIGANGAGKSSLLKVINGLIRPDTGKVQIWGSVGALITLGLGFNPVLTGRENIFVNAAYLGLSRQEVVEKLDRILEFAEIGDFIDAPLRTYSSGMRVRLGFAIATQMNPDILLVDEVLSVGDSSFRQRCTDWFDTFTGGGGSVIFVSHNTTVVENLADRVLLLDKGKVSALGDPHEVIKEYEREALEKSRLAQSRLSITPDIEEDLTITDVSIVKNSGGSVERIRSGDRITIRINYESREERELPSHFEIRFKKHGKSDVVSLMSMLYDGIDGNQLPTTGAVECDIETDGLTPGLYRVEVGIQSGPSVRLGKKWLVPVCECMSFVIEVGDFGSIQPGAPADVVVNRLAPAYLEHSWRIGGVDL